MRRLRELFGFLEFERVARAKAERATGCATKCWQW
jgi:hypothetical protein